MGDTNKKRGAANEKVVLLRSWFHSQLSNIRERQRYFFVSTDRVEARRKVANLQGSVNHLK